MIGRQAFRGICTSLTIHNVDRKALLGELRKKTGFSFNNCRKALVENNNDLAKAKQWLADNAQKEGWARATKLEHRSTSQGLIAMLTQENQSALVEVNCETDFVARNEKFSSLAELAAKTILYRCAPMKTGNTISKISLSQDEITRLKADDGKTIADHTALAIGLIGENINVKRALCMTVDKGMKLFGAVHPASINPGAVAFGKYAALVALQCETECSDPGRQLCQHVIGLRPVKLGNPETDQPAVNSDEETALLFQEFLLNPQLTVREYLEQQGIRILEFARYEMGEEIEQQQEQEPVEARA